MKNKQKLNSLFSSFLTSFLLTLFIFVAVKYYITFSNETAGSYQIAVVFGDSLKIFLIKVLSLAIGVISLVTFALKSSKKAQHKVLFPAFITAAGVLWFILPFLSAYTVSRFSGNLTTQSVAGIAIIANVVFMMVSVCCTVIGAIDFVHTAIMNVDSKESKANIISMVLSGVAFGVGIFVFAVPIIISSYGLNYVFSAIGVLLFTAGLYMIITKTDKFSN